jgi:tRNA pseudouridine55 synthase
LGWTSFQLVNKIKHAVKAKTGHGGTLDPLATGLMILATGKSTRDLNHLINLPKRYTGSLYLGATTPSFDHETNIDSNFPLDNISEENIMNAAVALTGPQTQVPPVFSAVKVNGTRSYKKARLGHDVELKAREIEIYSFKILKIALPLVYFEVFCSKGTYIRALARDFGEKLSSGAFLNTLRRTQIGEYQIKDAWELPDLIPELQKNNFTRKAS